jgi:DNA polymerase III subunit beta
MKFSVVLSEIREKMQVVAGIVPSNPVLPILENVLIKIDGNTMKITATDLQSTVTCTLACESSDTGTIAVPAKLLLETLKKTPAQRIDFSTDGDTLTMKTSSGKYLFSGEPAADYPKTNELNFDFSTDIAPRLLIDAIQSTVFCTSKDELRPAMTGVLFEFSDGELAMVSTDAHSLSKVAIKMPGLQADCTGILPVKSLNAVANAITGKEQAIQVSLSHKNAQFCCGDTVISCILIDAKYPNYKTVIPSAHKRIVNVSRSEILSCLKRVSGFVSQQSNTIVLVVSEREISIKAVDIDHNNAADEAIACYLDGEGITIAFNCKKAIEVLSVLSGENVRIELTESNRAAILKNEEQSDDFDCMLLLMPVLIS